MSSAISTIDHDEIREWVKRRNGRPAIIRTGAKGGILRIDFDEPEDGLEQLSWDEFFNLFEDARLAFLRQDETEDGRTSRFNKFIER